MKLNLDTTGMNPADLRPPAPTKAQAETARKRVARAELLERLLGPEAAEETPFVDPTTSEIVDLDDADEMIDAFERIKAKLAELNDARVILVNAMAEKARTGVVATTSRTLRLSGKRRMVKIELPPDGFNQSKLKEAYYAYPQFRDRCLSIATLSLKKVEYSKLQRESGTPDFNVFRNMLASACSGPAGNPTVTVEM